MEDNLFNWYPTSLEFGAFVLIALFVTFLIVLFIQSRKQKPEEDSINP